MYVGDDVTVRTFRVGIFRVGILHEQKILYFTSKTRTNDKKLLGCTGLSYNLREQTYLCSRREEQKYFPEIRVSSVASMFQG